jgi:predicted phosphodiesterase
MRLAVLSDVHGNAFALEAVLADIRSTSPDAVYNLGDTVWGGADPARAWALQLEYAPPTVRGNTDEFLLANVAELHDETRTYRAFLEEQLGAVPPELGRLPVFKPVADGEVLLAHGSPRDPWEYLMWDMGGEGRPASPAELRERLGETPARVVLVGHSHQELLNTQLGLTLVNVGAVSRQKNGDPAARWVLLEKAGGVWNVQFRRVGYDTEAAAKWAEAHALDGADEARVLRTGRR